MTTAYSYSYPVMDRLPTSINTCASRKRKAEIQDNNERLSKRLSLLNLERCSQSLQASIEHHQLSNIPVSKVAPATFEPIPSEDVMQMDDSKHKVYIYDLDAELSEAEPDDNRLILLPNIEKQLRECRIPRPLITTESPQDNQMVLYRLPDSLSVSGDQDSVRRAFIETRARAQAKQLELIKGIAAADSARNDDATISGEISVGHDVRSVTNQEQDLDSMDLDIID